MDTAEALRSAATSDPPLAESTITDENPRAPPAAGDGLRLGFLINLAGRGAIMVSGGIISLLLARHYGAETFGRWSVATAYATLVGTLLDGGFHRLLMRDVGRAPDAARGVVLNIVKRRIQIAAISVPAALLLAALTVRNFRTWALVAVLVLSRLVWDVVATFSSVLYAFDRFRIPNVVETVRRCLLLAVVVILIVADAAVEWAGIATLVLCILGSSAIIRPALQVVASKTATPPDSPWRDAAWFWLNGVLFWINAEVDQLLLAWLGNEYQTGIYAAAVRLVLLCLIIPRAVNDTVIRRWFRAGSQVDEQMATTTLLLAGAGGLLGFQFMLFPREIISIVYSARYVDAAPCFAVLGAFLALNFARCAPTWFIATSDRVPLSTAFFALAALGNFVGNLWLIPRYGALGAAYATTASELLLLCLAYGTIGRRTPKLLVAGVLGILPALLAVGLSVMLRVYVPWYVACAIALSAGGAALFVLAKRSLVALRPAHPG